MINLLARTAEWLFAILLSTIDFLRWLALGDTDNRGDKNG